jgi:hypothetical protein
LTAGNVACYSTLCRGACVSFTYTQPCVFNSAVTSIACWDSLSVPLLGSSKLPAASASRMEGDAGQQDAPAHANGHQGDLQDDGFVPHPPEAPPDESKPVRQQPRLQQDRTAACPHCNLSTDSICCSCLVMCGSECRAQLLSLAHALMPHASGDSAWRSSAAVAFGQSTMC